MGAEESREAGQGQAPLPEPISQPAEVGSSDNRHPATPVSPADLKDVTKTNFTLNSRVNNVGSVAESEAPTDIDTPRTSLKPDFPFKGSNLDILKKILEDVFILEGHDWEYVWPTYRQGMLAGYIRVGKGDEAENENINLQVLRVNKLFRAVGGQAFYGDRTFCFNNPTVCNWWVKRIGSYNFSKIRSLTVMINSGYQVYGELRSAIDLTAEEEWFNFFCWMEDKHRLSRIYVELCQWENVHDMQVAPGGGTMNVQEKGEIIRYRHRLLQKISSVRGVKHAIVKDRNDCVLSQVDCERLCRLIIQGRETLPKLSNQRDMSLAEVMATVGLNEQQYGPTSASVLEQALEMEEEERNREHKRALEAAEREESEARRKKNKLQFQPSRPSRLRWNMNSDTGTL